MTSVFDTVQSLAALYSLCTGVSCLNRMSCRTSHLVRFTFSLLVTGALCDILWIWKICGDTPDNVFGMDAYDLFDTMWVISIAVYVGVTQCRRRAMGLKPCEARGSNGETCKQRGVK